MEISFREKVAFVTGGGSGIGQATAIAFGQAGAKVVVVDIDVQASTATIAAIREGGGEAIAIAADVSNATQVEGAVQQAIDAYGRLDCAFNNVGLTGPVRPMAECEESDWEKIISVNLKGVWLCMKYQIRHMLKQQRGAIVNTSSNAGVVAFPGMAPYVASKHGVIGLTRAAALDYIKAGIRINAVCPGTILTPALQAWIDSDPDIRKPYTDQMLPIGRLGRPEEIAAAVLFLCSDQAGLVVGTPFLVDGGYTAV